MRTAAGVALLTVLAGCSSGTPTAEDARAQYVQSWEDKGVDRAESEATIRSLCKFAAERGVEGLRKLIADMSTDERTFFLTVSATGVSGYCPESAETFKALVR